MLNIRQILEYLTSKVENRNDYEFYPQSESNDDLEKAIGALTITISSLETISMILNEIGPHLSKLGKHYKEAVDTLTFIAKSGLFPPTSIDDDKEDEIKFYLN